ncbi:MAG TPA: hypothetical protein VFQ51_15325 [Vicinamibacteria bacterium]|nr:hypothetical protein [Vicinamibacteria bacterium]
MAAFVVTPRVLVHAPAEGPHRVSLVGLSETDLSALASGDARQRALAVYAGEPRPDLPTVAGRYETDADGLHFLPLFRFSPGVRYTVRVRTGSLALDQRFEVEAAPGDPPRVTAVHPSGDSLPENALRLYLHFSRPMALRDATRHVHLVEADGREIDLAFVDVEGGLWDPARTRLTLIFHPGRVKRGVAPGERMGPPLRAGREYRLVVDAEMADAQGMPLGRPFAHRFRAVDADREPPRAEGLVVEPPAGRHAPVSVRLPEPLDHALLARWIWVEDRSGGRVEGQRDALEGETVWRLTPDRPWTPGPYTLRVERALEDRAGNRFDRAFDREPGAAVPPPGEPIRLPFEVR